MGKLRIELDESLAKEVKEKFIYITKGVSMLPVNDLEDVIMLICEVVNDIDSNAGLMGYVDDLPLLYAAYEGKENIIPQANDIDPVEEESIKNKMKVKLKLSNVPAEDIYVEAFEVLHHGNKLRLAIKAAREASTPPPPPEG